METNRDYQSTSLLSLVKAGVIRSVSCVRTNRNGYLYVTLLNGRKATNVYFGKKTSEMFADAQVLTADELKAASIGISSSNGYLKFSLSNDNGNYTDLGAAFGIATASINESVDQVVIDAVAAQMVERVAEPETTN